MYTKTKNIYNGLPRKNLSERILPLAYLIKNRKAKDIQEKMRKNILYHRVYKYCNYSACTARG